MQEIVQGMHCAIYKATFYNFRRHLLKSIAMANDIFLKSMRNMSTYQFLQK